MPEDAIYLEVDCEVITIQKGKILVPVNIDLSTARKINFDTLVNTSPDIKLLAQNNTNLHSINFILKPDKFYCADSDGEPDYTIETFVSQLED